MRSSFFPLLFVALCSGNVAAEQLPSVTPYRPTVSNPAVLSQPGWLEIETGWLDAAYRNGAKDRALPYTLKFALSDDFGVLLGGNAYLNQVDASGSGVSGQGDTLLLLKNKWDYSASTALGLEYGASLPTANHDLGSGATDYLVNGILSTAVGEHTLDFNLGAMQLGKPIEGAGAQRWNWAATWSYPLDEQWGIAAEFSGLAQDQVQPNSQFLMSASYALSRRVVLDAGFARGLREGTPDQLFFGLSALLGKMF